VPIAFVTLRKPMFHRRSFVLMSCFTDRARRPSFQS
jgi:hypothetical protein